MLSSNELQSLSQAIADEKIVKVIFMKHDGSIREMTCVKNPSIIGIDWDYKDGSNTDNGDDDLQTVFDVDINEFRRFNYSSVQSWNVVS